MKNILHKLHAIMSEVDYIQKDKRNEFHHYNYASEAAIKEKIHEQLVKHGVLFTASVTNATHDVTKTAKGNEEDRTTASLTYEFYDIESGESLKGSFVGVGQDAGDKGIYKAITGAIKYILTTTFLIPTGDDPETDDERPVEAAKRPLESTEPPKPATRPLPTRKVCPDCGKEFTGDYPRCYQCNLTKRYGKTA